MIVIVAQDRVDTDRWSVHYRRGESMVEDIVEFARQIVNLTAYAMIRVPDSDARQTFQNRTVQRIKLDPKQFVTAPWRRVS